MEWSTIIPVFTFILGLLGKIFYDMWHDNYIEKKRVCKESLQKHFSDLEEQYIKPTSEFLSNFSNQDGRLTYFNTKAQYSVDAAQTSWPTNDLDKNFNCFKAHFSTAANELLKLETQVKINNEKNKAFNAEIAALLEEKSSVPVSDYFKKAKLNVPFFSQSIITFIRLSYMEYLRIQSGDKEVNDQIFNFHEVIYSPSQEDKNTLVVGLKDGRHLAKVNNMNEAEICKKALIEIAEDTELMIKGQTLYRSANVLKNWAENLSQNFYVICEHHSKFGKALKKKKDCPVCKLIFEE